MIDGMASPAAERVLVVEHDVADARLIVAALSEVAPFDFEIDFATNIAETEALLAEHTFEIVLLDVSLPDISWADAIDRVAAMGNHSVIVIAPVNNEQLGIRAVQHGAQDYVLKGSLRKSELGRSIRYALERQHLLSESSSREERLKAAVEAQKMWVVGRLAATVAHEFNNLLTGLIGDAELLRRGVVDNEPYATYASSLSDGLAHAALLTHQLVAFSRKGMTGPQVMDMDRMVDGLLPVLQGLLGPDVKFDVARLEEEEVTTRFRIELPPNRTTGPSGDFGVQGDTFARVLVVEDEEVVRRLLKRVLAEAGYDVTCCADGAEALAAVQDSPRFDLLVTDVVMPHMNGRELDEQLRARNPDLKTLFMSGYSGDLIAPDGALVEGENFLPKPFRLQDMLKMVRLTLRD